MKKILNNTLCNYKYSAECMYVHVCIILLINYVYYAHGSYSTGREDLKCPITQEPFRDPVVASGQ